MRLPMETNLVFDCGRLVAQVTEKCRAFFVRDSQNPVHEISVDVKQFAASAFVCDDDWVLNDGKHLTGFSFAVLGDGVAEALHEVMLCRQAIDLSLDFVGKTVVGGTHIRKERVAAHWWEFDAVKDRSHRGCLSPRDVVVPRVFVASDFRRLFKPDQLGYPGVRRNEWMNLEITETLCKRNVLV